MPRLGALILAAGSATRMGQIKQLLPYRQTTLVEHAVTQAQQAGFDPIVVVLGAQAEAVKAAVACTGVASVVNENWQTGMGSSLVTGLTFALQLAPQIDGLAILLADQPLITAAHLEQMGRAFHLNRAPILAATYSGKVGVPAIFHKSVFDRLLKLPPDTGARSLLRGGDVPVESFDLPEAETDIDTPADYTAIQ